MKRAGWLRSCLRATLLSFVLAASFACNGEFGRAIVGESGNGTSPQQACLDLAPQCALRPTFPVSPRPAPGFVLTVCDSHMPCVLSGGPTALSACDLALPLQNGIETRLGNFECGVLALEVPVGVLSTRIAELSLFQAELSITATNPATVELSHAFLSSVRIELHGPVQLRITEHSSLLDAQIAVTDASEASLDLVESSTAGVAALGFHGKLQLERSTLADTQLFGDNVQLQNCSLQTLGVSTRQFFGTELRGEMLSLDVGQGVLAASAVDKIQLNTCDTLLIVSSQSYHSNFNACNSLQVDRSAIGDSIVLGPVESHINIWDGNAFGPDTQTSLASWQDTFSNNRLCTGFSHLSLSNVTSMVCNECYQFGETATERICSVPSMDEGGFTPEELVQKNPACPTIGMPPECNPVPIDPNPL
jgi:hypothetical protein